MRCFYMQRTKPDKEGNYKYYPCGHCEACRRRDATAWGIRSYFEALCHKDNVFLSLTYDDEHLPESKYPLLSGNLSKSDVQDFKKRLAYYVGPFRSVFGGEYGEETYRPHYHSICYGVSIDNPVFYDKFWSPRKKAWIARCKAWDKGEVCLGEVTQQSCFYVSKYSLKGDKRLFDAAAKQGSQRPFRLVSNYLGYEYLLKEKERIMFDGFIRFKGRKISIPRYFFDKMFPVDSFERKCEVERRQQRAKLLNDNFWSPYLPIYGTVYSASLALGDQQEINAMKGK